MSGVETVSPDTAVGKRKLLSQGEDGLFFQSWYPVCFGSEVARGAVIGREFLDGRVIIFRGENDVARVTSAYCPHLGADLAVGRVIGNSIQCAFHRWEYDQRGVCTKTGIGDPAPHAARLFAFPTCERYGIIWAFNGSEPLWPIPDLAFPESRLTLHNYSSEEYACDGWVFACNTPDMQHIKVVHGVTFDGKDPHDLVQWDQWSHSYVLKAGLSDGTPIDWRLGINGTSIYLQQGTVDDWWLGIIIGFSSPRPGHHKIFACIAVDSGDGSEAGNATAQKHIAWAEAFGKLIASEDWNILNTIRFRRGLLTKADRTLARFLDFLQAYPRAHPSVNAIR
ncbi:MAG TPA: Rieske 2Fe-2S domain-containing protein [Steroidobacteraceae bacterium]|nr:Rieske 2Fe-2S domain-containing protein [Steroidobacteraceae bacterium]